MVGVVLALNAIIEANKEGDFISFLLCSYVWCSLYRTRLLRKKIHKLRDLVLN